jgi:hypothetical protein
MQPPLVTLADIRTGITLRGADASRRIDEGGLQLLRISDITEDGHIAIENTHLVDRALGDDPRYRVSPNDLLVANRGTRMTAALMPDGLAAVASGQLFIVRPYSDLVIPGYLHWFLNLPSTQEHLRSHARGSYVKTLSISVLKDLAVPVLPIELQHKVCEIAALAARERDLLARIAEQRQLLVQGAFKNLLNEFTT